MIDNSNTTTDSRAVEGIDSELFNILQTETAYNNKSDNKVICPNKRPNVIHIGLQHEFSKIIEANRERIISYIYPTDNYLFNIKGTNDLLVLENKLELPVEEKQIIVNFDALVEKYCSLS